MKKILFLTLLFLVFLPSVVKAYCSDSEEIRLQKLAKNINISYVYNESNGRFTITLSNLKDELTILEVDKMKKHRIIGDLTIDGLSSGKHSYIIYASNTECSTSELTTKYVMLPFLNPNYDSEECKGIENYSYCSKWLNDSISYDVWYKRVTEYKKKQQVEEKETKVSTSFLNTVYKKAKSIYGKYYYIILPVIIVMLGMIIIIKNKKDSLV